MISLTNILLKEEDLNLPPEERSPRSNIEYITPMEAIDKIYNSGDKIFTVTFIKRTDGTRRTMNARRGVTKNRRGGELRYDPAKKGLIAVWDIAKGDYRMINANYILSLRIGRKKYVVKK